MAKRQLRFSALWSFGIHCAVFLALWHSPLIPSFSNDASASSQISISLLQTELTEQKVSPPPPPPPEPKPEPVKPKPVEKPVPKKKTVSIKPQAVPVKEVTKPSQVTKEKSQSQAAHAALMKSARSNYFGKIIAMIAREKQYPSRAQRLRLEGKTELQVIIGADGTLQSAEIARESSSPLFDREAIRMANAAAPFPAPPAALGGSTPLRFSIPIIFEMN